jgi:hypothetical protein
MNSPSFFIKGREVAKEVLRLFKQNEIALVPKYSSTDYAPKVEVIVKDPVHPVVKYYENHSRLLIGNKIFGHGQIPKINPIQVRELIFGEHVLGESGELVLIVKINLDYETSDFFKISYDVEQPPINYFMVDDSIYTKSDLESNKINLEKDYVYIKTLFGKEAVDIFQVPDYSQGIRIYKRNTFIEQ